MSDANQTPPPAAAVPPVPQPGRPDRRMRWVLTGSLVLNLLLVGLVAGSAVGDRWHGMRGDRGDVAFGPLTGALTPDDRKALKRRFFTAAPGFREDRAKMQADFAELARGMKADPWDRAGAEAILERQGERGRARLEQGRTLFLDYVASLSPEARRALADRIETVLTRPRGMKGGD